MAKTSFPGRSLAVRVSNDILDLFIPLPPSDLKKLIEAQRNSYDTKVKSLVKAGSTVQINDPIIMIARTVLEEKIGVQATAEFFGDKFVHVKDGLQATDKVSTKKK